MPLVIGFLRPVILMPVGLLAGLPAAQVEALLLHELAHIRRYDYLVNLLQIFVEGLIFYHPAVWWMAGVIRAERENCCDDLVVATQGDAYQYASALAALEHNRGDARQPALAANGGSLVKRIRRLLAQPETPRSALTPILSAAILSVTMVAALAAWQTSDASRGGSGGSARQWQRRHLRPRPGLQRRQTRSLAYAPPAASRTLLAQAQRGTGDGGASSSLRTRSGSKRTRVAYIITNAERSAYKRLTTDEEREHFIEQFWMRRDPTPGTEANEFKEEH